VARPWQLRHKLVLGLGLVVASVGLLLGGALVTLSSYVEAGRVTTHRLNLIQVVVILKQNLNDIAVTGPHTGRRDAEKAHILACLDKARETLDIYRTMRANAPGADTEEDEQHYLGKLDKLMADLRAAVQNPPTSLSGQGNRRLLDDPQVRQTYDKLVDESTHLMLYIKGHVETAFHQANANQRRGLGLMGTATAIAVVLVLTLLYYFRVWVFAPIRQLHAGVQRVHRGDFDQPIALGSRDELEDLANEFNAMTGRLRETYKDLARQVNERSRQLVRSERMVSVGFLAAGVAHEINNPLASIAFCAEAMERRLLDLTRAVPDEADAVVKYLKVIQTEAFRCKEITTKLLDFSRSGERRREPTDLGRLIQDVIDVTRVLPVAQGKTIQFAPVYLVAAVSPPDLKSVVLNLVVNALESMDAGGTLLIGVRTAEGMAEMAFRDTGCGMSAEVQENIFEPFYTRRRTGNGTGLGLSISHQVIDQHGGSIQAHSDGPGKGSTFVVRVPVKAADEAPATLPMTRAA
jgi:two-component system, NtrC family, sensor kinase